MIAAAILTFLFHMEQTIGQHYDLFYEACGCLTEIRESA